MKSGDAVFLHLAATVPEPVHDVTLVFYDCEGDRGQRQRSGPHPARTARLVCAPTSPSSASLRAAIGPGCQGTLRVVPFTTGIRAHSARSWLGDNAIHQLGAVLDRLAGYQGRIVDIDGCTYREGLSAVRIDGE